MALDKKELISVRDYVPNDLHFILATWLRGLRYGNEWFGLIDSDAYYSVYHGVLDLILQKPETEIKIACLKDDPDVILGYSVYSGSKVHWCHVKSAWRSIGIAKSLLPSNITHVTHLTQVGKSIINKRSGTIKFNPFLIP